MIGSTIHISDISRLAEDRGCILKISMMGDQLMYWVENHYFIGRPYSQMDDLVEFIETLPLAIPGEAAANFSL